MKKFFQLIVLAFCLFFSVNISLAQKAKTKLVAQKKVDLGVLRQNTYTNDFFELKVEFPFGWLVGDNMLEAQLVAIQKTMVKAKNAKDQAAMNKAMNRVTPLLGGYKNLPGSVAENSSLRIMVENIASTPKIKTSRDYLNSMLESLKLTKLPAGFTVSEVKNEVLDGKTVDYIETKYLTSHKRNYIMMKKGFAILLTIDAYNQEEFEALHQVLTEADLDYKK